MRVLHISDIHYQSKFNLENPYEKMLSHIDSPINKISTIIKQVNNIDLIVITGDLCHAGSIVDYICVKDALDALKIPYVISLGNHDDKDAFFKAFSYQEINNAYLDVYTIDDISFISFDNSAYNASNGYIDDDRLEWLNTMLKIHSHNIVLMHHQFEDVPGIPGLHNGSKLKEVLIQNHPLAILNGHTHWFKEQNLEFIPYYTAPSLSFHSIYTEEGSVDFYQCYGYVLYEIEQTSINIIQKTEKEEKFLKRLYY